MLLPNFLVELEQMGFSGVQSFPTIGLFDAVMRVSFEVTGMGFGLEVDMIRAAHDIDLLTTPYVFNMDEAREMVRAGDAKYVLRRAEGCHGFYGASSMERLPAELAITQQIADFKAVTFGPARAETKTE